jgi:hypothetical protein
MAKPTDDYCIARFFEVYAGLPQERRRGIITGLVATDRVMAKAALAQPAQLALLEPQPEPDGEGEPD